MGAIAYLITSLTIVYSIVYSDVDQRKHQSSASLAFVRGIHRGSVNSPHKWPVTRKMFPFDDVIMILANRDSGNDLLPVSHQAISRTISADILSNEQSKHDAVKFYLKCKHFHWQTFIYFTMSSAKWLSFPLGLGVSLTNNPTGIYRANTAFTVSWLCPGITLISQKTTIHQHNHSKSEGSISSITSNLICTVSLRFYW